MSVYTFARIRDAFDEQGDPFVLLPQVLKRISRGDTIFHCARLNQVVSTHSPSFDIADRLMRFVGPSAAPLHRLNDMIRKHRKDSLNPFFRGQLLELIRQAALHGSDLSNDGDTFAGPEAQPARDDLLRALLLAAEIWGLHVVPEARMREALHSEEVKFALLRRAYLENKTTLHLFRVLSRSIPIMRELLVILPEFATWFERDIGISLDTFRVIAVALNWHCVDSTDLQALELDQRNSGVFSIQSASEKTLRTHEFKIFLENTTQTIDALSASLRRSDPDQSDQSWDPLQRSLRNRPILVAPDGRMVVADPVAFRACLFENPIFQLRRKEERERAINAFTGAVERYVARWFQAIFPSSKGFTLEPRVDVPGGGDIDVAIRYGTTLVAVEVKAGFLRDDYVVPGNEVKFMKDLHDKVLGGAQQMSRDLKIVCGNGSRLPVILRGVRLILPVLVTNDSLLDSNVDKLFARNFWAGFPDGAQRDGWRVSGDVSVAAPSVLPVADVEQLGGLPPHFWLEHLMTYSALVPGARATLGEHMASRKVRYKVNRELEPDSVDDFLKQTLVWLFGPETPDHE